ncbi:MAG: deoxyguanosinetriphosphate triphosphohydrolase [Clostridiales bacterium]|nr:deoxyguanosinetriphosphate triphosphohydrolase [Clostridiales bacterium]
MSKSIREQTWELEKLHLSEKAALSQFHKGRRFEKEECYVRTAFQRDRDRIIHSNSFRRLKHKTQVFLSPEGDHYRTRLTHTLEVSQIARTIAKALRLNEDLAEAIALGHDLGHTPFGHAGERALDLAFKEAGLAGFKHYEQSLRVVDVLENDGRGLNLTYEVRNGIEMHTNGLADTLEGRVVKISDKIAYINHDIDDAINANVLCEDDIAPEIRQVLGHTKSQRINTLVISVIRNSGDDIGLGGEVKTAFEALHKFMFQSVYKNEECKSEEPKAVELVTKLYNYYLNNPDKLSPMFIEAAGAEGVARAAGDYIAGMTDRYAVKVYKELFVPKSWTYDDEERAIERR